MYNRDASHQIHPLTGLGLNLGLGDVTALTERLLQANSRGDDWGKYSISNSSMCDDLYLLSFCIHCGSRYQTIDILGQHHVSLQGCRVLIRGISS